MAKTVCMTPPRVTPTLPADAAASPYYPTPSSALEARPPSIFELIQTGNSAALIAMLAARPWLAITRVDADGNTPLMVALETDLEPGTGVAIITTLFQNSDLATLNRANNDGETALHIAADNNFTTIANALIQAGVTVDVEDGNGFTAFDNAIEAGHYDTANILARAGADLDSPSNPLIAAYQAHHNDLFQTLVARGADLNVTTEGSHMNLMMMAAIDNNVGLIEWLEGRGINVNTPDAAGRTALSYAAARHNDEAILKLHELGATIPPVINAIHRAYITSVLPVDIEEEALDVVTVAATDATIEEADLDLTGNITEDHTD